MLFLYLSTGRRKIPCKIFDWKERLKDTEEVHRGGEGPHRAVLPEKKKKNPGKSSFVKPISQSLQSVITNSVFMSTYLKKDRWKWG